MNSYQFRPGNFILSNSVEQINQAHLEQLHKCSPGASPEIKPIAITEDWLLSFGFKKVNTSWRSSNASFSLEIFGQGKLFLICHGSAAEVCWIHELQNHYLHICGEELTINYEPW